MQHHALIHYARENGSAVRFLDRTEVRDRKAISKPKVPEYGPALRGFVNAGSLPLAQARDIAKEVSSALLHSDSEAEQQ